MASMFDAANDKSHFYYYRNIGGRVKVIDEVVSLGHDCCVDVYRTFMVARLIAVVLQTPRLVDIEIFKFTKVGTDVRIYKYLPSYRF